MTRECEKGRLIELSSVIKDIAAGPFGSNLKVECFVEEGFPIIDGANLKGYKVTDNITKFVTEEKARSLYRAIARRFEVVVTISGTLGQIAYIPQDSKYEEYLVSQRQFRVAFDEEKVYVPYLVFYFHTYEGQHKILEFANQVGVPALSQPLKNFRQIKILLPTLRKQKLIAQVIENVNAKIESNKRANNILQQQAFALYQQMFVDNPNSSRRICRAEQVFDISIGKTPPRKEKEWFSDVRDKNVVWVSIADMGNCGMFISDSSEYLTTAAMDKYNLVTVPNNTVLLSFKLTVGRVAISDGAMTTNEAIAHFKTDNKAINEYLYCYLKKYNYQTLGSTSSIATAVNSKIIKAMPFIVPTESELKEFHSFAAPCFEKIRKNQVVNKRLATLRDTLLPKLMSGEIDVSNVQI